MLRETMHPVKPRECSLQESASIRMDYTYGDSPEEYRYITEMVSADIYCTGLPLAIAMFGGEYNLLHVMRDSTKIYPTTWGRYINSHKPGEDLNNVLTPELYVPHPKHKAKALKCYAEYMYEHAENCMDCNLYANNSEVAEILFGNGNFSTVEFAGDEIYVPNPIYWHVALQNYSKSSFAK